LNLPKTEKKHIRRRKLHGKTQGRLSVALKRKVKNLTNVIDLLQIVKKKDANQQGQNMIRNSPPGNITIIYL
jgi:hypothetical protein